MFAFWACFNIGQFVENVGYFSQKRQGLGDILCEFWRPLADFFPSTSGPTGIDLDSVPTYVGFQ
jgi:hypothetical protein